MSKETRTEKDVLGWMVENVNDNSVKTNWDFWGIYNDRTSAAWGWNEAQMIYGNTHYYLLIIHIFELKSP